MKTKIALLGLAAAAIATGPAATPALAASCAARAPLATIKMLRDSEGKMYFVPVNINGANKLMLLSTGSGGTMFLAEAVDAMKMPVTDLRGATLATAVGARSFAITHPDSLSLGGTKVASDFYAIFPAQADGDKLYKSNIVGWLGTDVLSHYDVDMDFANSTLKLYDFNDCEGAPRAGAEGVSYDVDTKGRLVVPVKLDGIQLNGVIDTSSEYEAVNLGIAQSAMKFDVSARDVEKMPDQAVSGAKVYRHNFKSLSLDGTTIANPSIYLIEDRLKQQVRDDTKTGTNIRTAAEDNRMPDFLIGNQLLSKLHVYVASKEKKLYITPVK